MSKTMSKKSQALQTLASLRNFIGKNQRAAMAEGVYGEESQWFIDKINEIQKIVSTMPKVYEQDGKGGDAVAYLRYFAGARAQWHITEKDSTVEQYQAFGLCDLFGDGGELGYVSIEEIIANNGELDLHYTPTTLRELQK